jgi:hypothetical protein
MDVTQLVILSVVPFILGFFIAWMIWGKYKEKVNEMQNEIRQLNLSVDQLNKKVEDRNQAYLEREGQLALIRGQMREKDDQLMKLQNLIQQKSSEKAKQSRGSVPKRSGRPAKVDALKERSLTEVKKDAIEPATIKRGPGRPKKIKTDIGESPNQPKRRGRPPKAKQAAPNKTEVKRGRGRPRKIKTDDVVKEEPKRRGRPPKSNELKE